MTDRDDLASVLEVIGTVGLPLAALFVVTRVVMERRRDTWTPLRRQQAPFGHGFRRFLLVTTVAFAATGLIPIVDGMRAGDAWQIAVGVVRSTSFAAFAWVTFETGREDGLEQPVGEIDDPRGTPPAT